MEDIQPLPVRFDAEKAPMDEARQEPNHQIDIAPALAQALNVLDAEAYSVDKSFSVRRWGEQPRASLYETGSWDAIGEEERGELHHACSAVFRDGASRTLLLVHAACKALLEPVRDGADVVAVLVVLRRRSFDGDASGVEQPFVDAAVHELRTPVTAIKGYAQLALMRLQSGDPSLLERALRTIVEQADRIGALVGQLGDAGRLQSGCLELHRERFDMVPILRAGVARMQQAAPRHSFRLSSPERLEGVWDRERIAQVLMHLLKNAVKYSPAGGSVDVELATEGRYAAVTVRDSGIGVSREQQAHVFEPWSTAHSDTASDFGGFGLGLSLCRAIVEQHGGGMWVESDAASGSLFGFRLPITAG